MPFGRGTDFNVALDLGVAHVLKLKKNPDKTRRAWIILFTDGDTEIQLRGSRDKYLEIQFLEDADQISVAIHDEGKGFDYRTALAGLDGGGEVDLSLKLITSCTDKLIFGNGGRSVTLVKQKVGVPGRMAERVTEN